MANPVRLLIGDKISERRKADDEGLEENGVYIEFLSISLGQLKCSLVDNS
jgi:hypothetical protein